MRSKLLMVLVASLLIGGKCTLLRAEDSEVTRDYVKIEKHTADGAKLTIVEGAGNTTSDGFVEATRVTTNTVRVPVKTVTKVVEVPVVNKPHKARLAVLPAVFSEHFKREVKIKEKIKVTGQLNLTTIFSSEYESYLKAPSLTASLVEAFVGSRKFKVLERARLTETLKEIDFGESDYADVTKVVPMGKALNSDYVVLPEVEVIQLLESTEDIPYIDQVNSKLKAKMILRVRVVDTAETKIVAAFTETVEVQREVKPEEPFKATEWNNLILDLYRAQSLRVMHRTIESIYPVRILEIKSGKVVLNRGEGSINLKEEFGVYALGKSYTDPDTGEFLGQGETEVAQISVTRVAPKFSEAQIIKGGDQLTGDPRTYLCRETETSIQQKTKVPRAPLGW